MNKIWRARAAIMWILVIVMCATVLPSGYLRNMSGGVKQKVESSTWCCSTIKEGKNPRFAVQDAKTYTGWKHPFWPPERSTNLSDYLDLNNYVTMDFEKDCSSKFQKWNDWKKHLTLFMFLHSNPHPQGRKARDDNRNTWMKDLNMLYPSVKVVFLIGKVGKEEDQQLLEKEQWEHCDLLQFDVMDAYENVSIKMGFALQYFHRLQWDTVQGPPQYFLNGDDDVYFNVKRLLSLTSNHYQEFPDACNAKAAPMIGVVVHNTKENVQMARDDWMEKWRIPAYLLDDDIPDYLSGTGFLIPRWSLPCLAEMAWKVQLLTAGDIFLAGFLRDRCSVNIEGPAAFEREDSVADAETAAFAASSFPENTKDMDKYLLHDKFTKL